MDQQIDQRERNAVSQNHQRYLSAIQSRQMDMQSRSLTHKILDTGMITVGQNGGRFLINMVLKIA